MGKTTHYQNNLLFALLVFLYSITGFSQVFDTPGTSTYTVPSGVYSITVEVWGAGGSGGDRSNNGYTGGGGGGAYARSTLTTSPGTIYNLSVGAGSVSFQPGQDSWFGSASNVMAKGGQSVANNNSNGASGGSATTSVGTTKFVGGNGANGTTSRSGGGGSSAGPTANGTNATNDSGATAPVGGGNGANGRNSDGNGYAGTNPGGGGGGTRRSNGTRKGGDGGNGQIFVTANYREINIVGNGNNIISGSTSTSFNNFTNFGSANVTNQTVTRTFTIQNTGNINLTIGAITFTGANANNFAVTSAPTSTVAGGASTTFAVTFNPNALGARNAVINIVNNDPDENPYTFAISGIGTNPEIEVKGNNVIIPNGQVDVSYSNFTLFEPTAIGSPITRQFQIENTSAAATALTIKGITITGANASDFSITQLPAATVLINSSTTFELTFSPTGADLRTAIINIENDDSDENPSTFVVAGVGKASDITVSGNSLVIANGDTTPSMTDHTNFGGAHYLTGTRTRTYTIKNTSTSSETLTIGAIAITGLNSADFVVTTPPAATVPVGGETTFTITFDPSSLGSKTANIRITNNAPGKSPYLFTVVGLASNSEIDVLGNGVSIVDGSNTASGVNNTDFGTVSIDNGSVLVTYTIKNSGTTALYVGEISFTGPGASSYSVSIPPASSVPVNGFTTFEVNFAPQTIGVKNARIIIINDDQNEDPYDFAITGLAVRTYPDTDGDGIPDNIDIDDDNDGIPDIYEQFYCTFSPISKLSEHVFLNETFGTGTTRGKININVPGATSTYCYEDGIVGPNSGTCDFQHDWSLNDGEYTVNSIISAPAGDPRNISTWSSTNWTRQSDHTGDVNGRMAIFNASYAPQIFYETRVSGIMPNVPLEYSFWALNIMSKAAFPGTILPNITVEFIDTENDAIISSFNTENIGRCAKGSTSNTCEISQWINFTTSVNLGEVTSFIIRFKNNAPGGSGNDLALDDITIRQEYCDYDGDGISNLFDLDSDNDGIPDIEENGFKHLSDGRGMMDLNPAIWRDENRNGLHDEIDALIESGLFEIRDSDYDGVPDFLDLDSDNDGIFDVDEAGLLNGDGDVDGNGVGDGADSDGDGILDVFDAYVGRGSLVRPYAQVTSITGIPDYLNIDSNDDGIFDIVGTFYEEFDTYFEGTIAGTADLDLDGIFDEVDTDLAAMGSPRDFNKKLYLNLDGRNDYASGPQWLSGLPKSTIMGWIKLSNPYGVNGLLFGQDNFNMRVNSDRHIIVTAKGQTTSTLVALDVDRWYHVAAVYDGASATQRLKLFVNGEQISFNNAGPLSGSLTASTTPFTIGKNPANMTQFFKGDVDEVRIFNTALTADQIQKMVYQEVRKNGTFIRGEVIPRDIESTTWSSMIGYFRMDVYKNDVIDNLATATTDIGTDASFFRIYNVKNIRYQQAPMPFVTTKSDLINLAVSENNFVNGQDVITYNWSILNIKHDIDFESNHTDLGLIIDPSIQVKMFNDTQLRNTWYLKLDGNIDLIDKSQLIQTSNSILDAASIGKIERDQQGQSNKFNYNYWGSPVSSSNNGNYTIANVLRDGTNPDDIKIIQWTTALNSVLSSPITLSNRWLYKFQNLGQDYANWTVLTPTTTLSAGEGFTLKGSSASAESQNYTFVGRPNNGNINLAISANNQNLTGNPYPSAIDATAFINTNLDSTTGTLLFWEHYSTNDTHILHDYQGGYATRTLVGGTPPVAPIEVSGLGSSARIPGRYIPVGQGFFVVGNTTGGTIKFRNSHRAFIKEDHADSNTMFKSVALTQVALFDNSEDTYEDDEFSKIRLAFISPNNYNRQLLLGFMDDSATEDLDAGYDAILVDVQPSDMYFKLGTDKLNIQGVGHFNANNIYPLGVKTHMQGTVKIVLESTEFFDDSQSVFIYDSETEIYHNLRDGIFSMVLPAGSYDRFSLRFTDSALTTKENKLAAGLSVTHSTNDSMLNMVNNLPDVEILKVDLYNIVGQLIKSVNVEEGYQHHIKIPVNSLQTGTYIAKITSSNGVYTTKIILE